MPGLSGKLSVSVKCLWKDHLSQKHGTLSVGQLFKSKEQFLVIGQEDGVIKSYGMPSAEETKLKPLDSYETKGGPIQNIILYDVTRFKSTDMVCSDSHGAMTIFCNGQILMRKKVSTNCLSGLSVKDDLLGHISIVCSDNDGHICFIQPYGTTTRLRLADIAPPKDLGTGVSIKSLLAVNLADVNGQLTSYVLVGDNCCRLHVFHQGSLVSTLNTPSSVTAMCSGRFLIDQQSELSQSNHQVALGTESGAIYILQEFEIFSTEYCSRNSTITHLSTCSVADGDMEDLILCAGHFNGLYIFHKGKEMTRVQTDDWVSSIAIPHKNSSQFVIGCTSGNIHGLQLHYS